MIPGAFTYHAPTSLEEAVSLLAANAEEGKILAGGQSLLPLMKLRLAKPQVLIDIGRLDELRYIRDDGHHLSIGSLTTYRELHESPVIQSRCPLLAQAALVVGDVQVRNRGTLGGGLAHADPAEDLPAAILALNAELKAVGSSGERWIPASEFYITMLTSVLMPDEILTEIRVPVLEGYRTCYRKAAQRAAGFAVVGVAVCLKTGADNLCEDIAIGITGVADKAYRAMDVEKKLRGEKLEAARIEDAAMEVARGLDVLEDVNATAEYRTRLAQVYVARTIQSVLSQ